MSIIELCARLDKHVRPLLVQYLPPRLSVALYSNARPIFLKHFAHDIPDAERPPEELERTLWGIRFRTPLMNAAGMFKNGDGYQLSAAQGAGAYLAGTTTGPPRSGNRKEGITHPFAVYPRSMTASNWLGMPNDGDIAVAGRLARLSRVVGCPVGVSVTGSPDLEGEQKLAVLVQGLNAYARAGVDFIEINESCPNVAEGEASASALAARLEYLEENFLKQRDRQLPVLVKFSVDSESGQIEALCRQLLQRGFDGITLGNTSTQYQLHRGHIHPAERKLYDYFTTTFGGGLSGEVLNAPSASLVRAAKSVIDAEADAREFHIVQAGGILAAEDVYEALENGASLVQWYTGYFESFAVSGHALYQNLYAELLRLHS